jgi:fumarate reductase subunit D
MARSNKPIVWGPFAAGGTLTAFLTPVLIVLTLLAALGRPPEALGYERLHALVHNPFFKLGLAGVIGLSLWSAAHRLRITAYDLGLRADTPIAALLYAATLACTGAAIYYLLRI